MILSPSGEVAAVVDWELCTLGDPLADVGMLLVYWSEAGDELMPLFEPGDDGARLPAAREDVRERYAERSGRDLAEIDFYVALGFWKLAIILEGVYARYAAGQYGKPTRRASAVRARSSSASPRPPTEAERGLR